MGYASQSVGAIPPKDMCPMIVNGMVAKAQWAYKATTAVPQIPNSGPDPLKTPVSKYLAFLRGEKKRPAPKRKSVAEIQAEARAPYAAKILALEAELQAAHERIAQLEGRQVAA